MRVSELKKRITEKSVSIWVDTDTGKEKFRFPLLTVGDWAEVKRETGVDAWELLLSASSEHDPSKLAKMSPEDVADLQRAMSINLLKQVSQAAQQYMVYCSLRRADKDTTLDDADYITTYGLSQNEYMKLVNFLIYGLSSDDATEEALAEKKEAETVKPVEVRPTP